MKIAALIARFLMGLVFVAFGLNGFLPFIPQGPMPGGSAGQFIGALMASHYMLPVCAIMLVSGVLFLINRYVPLALTLIGPVIVNILLFHLFMLPNGIGPGAVVGVCWILVALSVRSAFAGIWQQRT
jgi:hypothetical protein